MKSSSASSLLKIVLAVSAAALLFVVFWCFPAYMRHVVFVRPDLAGWAFPMEAYIGLMSIPVFACIVLLWQVFGTLSGDNAFSMENAKRFTVMKRLAIVDLGLAALLAAFLLICGVTAAFIAMCLTAIFYVGVVSIIVFHVLAGLVRNAAEIKQDHELTI